MTTIHRRTLLALAIAATATSLHAQDSNFADRKAIIINAAPFIELSNFRFGNSYADRRTRFFTDLSWKNTGTQPIIAFEIVVLKYDAFDQRQIGTRWTVTGRDSANWQPLGPGESASDSLRAFGSEEVLTAIAYVRQARLADGTVWRVNEAELAQKLRQAAPSIKDFGSTRPDPKPTPAPAAS